MDLRAITDLEGGRLQSDSGSPNLNVPWDPGVSLNRRQIPTRVLTAPAPPPPPTPADGSHLTLTRHKDRGDSMNRVSKGKRSDAAGDGLVSSDHVRNTNDEDGSDLPFSPHHTSPDPLVHHPSTTQLTHASGVSTTSRATNIEPHPSYRVASDRDHGMGTSTTNASTQNARRRERRPEDDEDTDGVEDRERYRSRPRRCSPELDPQKNLSHSPPKPAPLCRSLSSAPSPDSDSASSPQPMITEPVSNSSLRRNPGCDLGRDGPDQHTPGSNETRMQWSPSRGEYQPAAVQVPGLSRARSSSFESVEEWDEDPSPQPPPPLVQKSANFPIASGSTSQPAPTAGSMLSDSELADETVHLRALLGCPPGAPVGLDALADPPPGEKPNYPLPTLIKLAIYGSPRRRLTLQEIYQALEDRFEWFRQRTDKLSWKNSIRHNLSLRKCFLKVQRPITEPGKGSYWMIDLTQGEGNKRVRKRNKKPTKGQLAAQAAAEAYRASARLPGQGDGLRPVPYPTPSHALSQSQVAEETHVDDEEFQALPMQTNFATAPIPEEQHHHHSVPRSSTTTSTQQHSQPSGMSISLRQLHGHQNAAQPLPFPPSHEILGLNPNINPTVRPVLSKDGLSHHAVGGPAAAGSHYDILFQRGQSVSGTPQIQQQASASRQQVQVTLPPPLDSSHPTYHHHQLLSHQGKGPHISKSQTSHVPQRSPSFLQQQLQPDVSRQMQMTAAPQQPAASTQTQLQPPRLPPMRTLSGSPAPTASSRQQQPALPPTLSSSQHQHQQDPTTATATTSEFARFASAHVPTGFGKPSFGKSALGGNPPSLMPMLRPLSLSGDKGKRRAVESADHGDAGGDKHEREREGRGIGGGGGSRRQFVPPSARTGIEYVQRAGGGLVTARRTSEHHDERTVEWINRLDRDEENRDNDSGAPPAHEDAT